MPAALATRRQRPTVQTAGAVPLPPKTEAGAGGLRKLSSVVLFSAGWHVDSEGNRRFYSPAYCRQFVSNFHDLLQSADPHLEPPAVLGHEEDQARLKAMLGADQVYQKFAADPPQNVDWLPTKTDVPAAGWPRALRFDDGTGEVCGDLDLIPPSVAVMIETGQLKFPSVELYHEFSYAGKNYGPVLRRVGLLGGQPPGNKAIPALGSGGSRFVDGFGAYTIFADGGNMATASTDDPLVMLLAKEFPDLPLDFLASQSPDQLKQLAVAAVAEEDTEGDAEGGTPANPAQMGDVPPNFDKAQCVTDILAAEKPADEAARRAELEAMPDADLYALWQKTTGGTGDGGAIPGGSMMSERVTRHRSDPAAAQFSESVRQAKADLAAEQKRIAAEREAFRKEADAERQARDARIAEEQKAAVSAFCESRLKAGKIDPWELDESDPKTAHRSIRQRLLRLDAKAQVSCFAEGGVEVKKTPLQIEMDAIDARPVRRFGEMIAQPAPGPDAERQAQKKAVREFHAARNGTTAKN